MKGFRAFLVGLVALLLVVLIVTLLVMEFSRPSIAQAPSTAYAQGGSGGAKSYDDSGSPVGVVSTGGSTSPESPFVVNYMGRVDWEGSTDSIIRDIHWDVRLFGREIQRGLAPNVHGQTHEDGSVRVADYIPIQIPGLYLFSGSLVGDGGDGEWAVWVKLDGSPASTVPGKAAWGLLIAGIALLYFSLPHVKREKR